MLSPPVRIASSNELEPFQAKANTSATDPSVHHNLLDHAQCLGSVGLVKEQNCVNFLVCILSSHLFCLFNFKFDVFVCSTSMNLRS